MKAVISLRVAPIVSGSECEIGQRYGYGRLHDYGRTQCYANVVAALYDERVDLTACAVERHLLARYRGRGLHRRTHHNGIAVCDAADDAAGEDLTFVGRIREDETLQRQLNGEMAALTDDIVRKLDEGFKETDFQFEAKHRLEEEMNGILTELKAVAGAKSGVARLLKDSDGTPDGDELKGMADSLYVGWVETARLTEKAAETFGLELASGGALISEYPPGTEHKGSHFAPRNRIQRLLPRLNYYSPLPPSKKARF